MKALEQPPQNEMTENEPTMDEHFYFHNNSNTIGSIIFGFIIHSNQIQFIFCGQSETLNTISSAIQKQQFRNHLILKILHQLNTVNPADFSLNMNQHQIASVLGLRHCPKYIVDTDGYIQFETGLLIQNQFVLIDAIGSGAFSNVFKAVNMQKKTFCALKIIRNEPRFESAAKMELKILRKTKEANKTSSVCIHLQCHFAFKGHQCLSFKLFGPSILDVLKNQKYKRLSNEMIQTVAFQIFEAIAFLHSLKIIFTDLKPENIIFVDSDPLIGCASDTRIKLIDFGSAVFGSANGHGHGHMIQTRHYRAPEVILGMRWMEAVDVWSVGCVLLELLNGKLIFATNCSIDHLHQIGKVIGPIPAELIRACNAKKFKILFDDKRQLNMKNAKISRMQPNELNKYFDLHNVQEMHLFNLVSACLCWKAKERISAKKALDEPYFGKNESVKHAEDGMDFLLKENVVIKSEKLSISFHADIDAKSEDVECGKMERIGILNNELLRFELSKVAVPKRSIGSAVDGVDGNDVDCIRVVCKDMDVQRAAMLIPCNRLMNILSANPISQRKNTEIEAYNMLSV